MRDNAEMARFAWDDEMRDALALLGVRPGPTTPPSLVKDFIGALYRYELRKLRDSLARGEIRKPEYAGRVAALRPRYWMLSIPAVGWAREIS
jgi:hypothetical protein